MENMVTITQDRYAQLIRSEHIANMLLALIQNAVDSYQPINCETLSMVSTMLIGKKEEDHV